MNSAAAHGYSGTPVLGVRSLPVRCYRCDFTLPARVVRWQHSSEAGDRTYECQLRGFIQFLFIEIGNMPFVRKSVRCVSAVVHRIMFCTLKWRPDCRLSYGHCAICTLHIVRFTALYRRRAGHEHGMALAIIGVPPIAAYQLFALKRWRPER
ncbi:hypothetical protein [Burkholderia sp. TSV86]|uniref:hypothetical protein n=1 Tax=Burkholderia sp. TSV86 TaxID=1385594 RepID=UPI000754FAC9|nr:hypothetical protein [Burkholderia sp. TSV86]KVE38232.1 hypothetical protein WS68_23845 [Burkholderia sp. TSV86]